ncbi:UNVERIFIED_CONTAM: hypothetical protein Slati_2441700 [Sesamum latifolium]|uniref:CCHC-type domain-containing protein n=1 Tax=Sesamum latifolium TaxID=2727402 RepID=A0AAW2WCK7_9LAMI
MVPLGLWHGESDSPGYYLVGRLLGRQSFNFEALKNTLLNSFNLIKGLEMRLIDNGRILFNFAHTIDRKRVIEGGPWAFEKNLLFLTAIEEDDDPASIDLNWVDFFVHVHGLSLRRMSRHMVEFIGNQLGKFRDVELDNGSQVWGSSLRIRVGLNVNKPLRRVLKLHTVLGAESTISFTYERLPNFCYWCGHLGHIMKFCELNNPPPKDPRRGVAIFNYITYVPQPISEITPVTPISSQITTDISSSVHNPRLAPLPSTLHTDQATHTAPIYSSSTPVTPLAHNPAVTSPLHVINHISALSLLQNQGRKKAGSRKFITVLRKRKLVGESLDTSESPSKYAKQTDDGAIDQSETHMDLAAAAVQSRPSL